MKTLSVFDAIRYRLIGSRYGSTAVQLEGQDTHAHWQEFLTVMTEFGFGPDELAKFVALLEQHRTLLHDRSQSVIAKGASLDTRNAAIDEGWTWFYKVRLAFTSLARTDAEVARALNEARADEDVELAESIRQLKTLLVNKGNLLSPAIPVAARIAEADTLVTRLDTVFGVANNAKAKPSDDTAEIDLIDGQLYMIIRDFNEAGRAAVRAGLIPERARYFRFNHIGPAAYRRNRAEDPAPEPTPEA